MTIKPEVLAAMEKADQFCGTYARGFAVKNGWQIIRAELLAMEARLAQADVLLRKIHDAGYYRTEIDANLSENAHD